MLYAFSLSKTFRELFLCSLSEARHLPGAYTWVRIYKSITFPHQTVAIIPTLALFASFSLVLPIFGLPRPVHRVEGLEKRVTFSGRVQVFYSHLAHISDCLA